MSIRKRVKISLPSGGTDKDDSISAGKLNKAKLSLLNNDEDLDEDEIPIAFIKKNKIKDEVKDVTLVEEESTSYDDIFKRTTKHFSEGSTASRILNLEDMIEEGRVSGDEEQSTTLPNERYIGQLKDLKERRLKVSFNDTGKKFKEKDYVALLEKDEKREIIETLKKGDDNGQEDEFNEAETDIVADERLPLSHKEVLLQDQQRKQMIEEAIQAQDDESTKIWEAQLLSKGSGQSQQVVDAPSRPIEFPLEDEDPEVSYLSDAFFSIDLRKRQIEQQLRILMTQRSDIEKDQASMTEQLFNWATNTSEVNAPVTN